jgi:hypothetical protein
MAVRSGISRRGMLAMSAAGGLAIGSGIGRAAAQTAKRIEKLAPELDAIISTSEPILELGKGFGGRSISRPTSRWRARLTACSPTSVARSPARPTA